MNVIYLMLQIIQRAPQKGFDLKDKKWIISTLNRLSEIHGDLSEGPSGSLIALPVYVGVGVRLTATVSVIRGKVDLGNLLALGAAAKAGRVSG